VQIFYSQLDSTVHSISNLKANQYSNYFWTVFYGPYGTAVDPCSSVPFTLSRPYDAEDGDINNPPFPPHTQWDGPLPRLAEYQCRIQGSGDGPPMLLCGQPSAESVIKDFQKDVQFDDPVIVCETKTKYHRGWTVEY
jgi:hypothetical protein